MKVFIQPTLKRLTQVFSESQFSLPKKEAEDLLSTLLECSRADLYFKESFLTEEQLTKLDKWLQRRLRQEPLEYISGYSHFYGGLFKVSSSVLIPRQETEILVDKIVQTIEKDPRKNLVFWDVCTGSGCIGISIKRKFPHLQVVLSDLSLEAVECAKENAALNGVEVEVYQGDLLAPFEGKKADYFVSNPPYISKKEYAILDAGVKDYEPKMALEAGQRGTEFYEKFAKELASHLNPSSKVWFEIGYEQGKELLELFSNPCWTKKMVEKDWALHDRFFFLEKE